MYNSANSKRFGEVNVIGEPLRFDPSADEMAGKMEVDLITEVGSLQYVKEDLAL